MASIKPILIICDESVIHKPKPKRINKIQNYILHINLGHFNHSQLNQNKNKTNRRHNHEKKKKNNNKTSEKISFNLGLISLEKIENDFNEFKLKNEEIEVQKELLNLLKMQIIKMIIMTIISESLKGQKTLIIKIQN